MAISAIQISAVRGGKVLSIDRDGKVNTIDISIVAKAFDSYPGHERWNPDADLNHNERIDTFDISASAECFGKTVCFWNFPCSILAWQS